MNRPAEEKLARISLILSNPILVEHRRFSRSSSREQMQSNKGGWIIDPRSKAFISVPTQEQIERLPDVDGNYSETQIRTRREKSIEHLKAQVNEYLDIDSPEMQQRIQTMHYFFSDDEQKATMREIYADVVEYLKSKNTAIESKLDELSILLQQAVSITQERQN